MQIRLRQISRLLIVGLLSGCGGGTVEDPIQDNVVASVSVTSTVTTIAPGGTVLMSAAARNAAGADINGLSTTWSSSNQAAATVSSIGLVTGIANGTTVITATMGGVSGNRGITVGTVTPSPSASVDATESSTFQPPQVDISAGGTVTWVFNPQVSHNVVFSTNTTGTPSGIGETYGTSVSRTFTTAGTFPYTCTLHSGMSGTVIVHQTAGSGPGKRQRLIRALTTY